MFRVMPVPLMLGLVSVACFAQSSSQSIDPPPAPVPQQQRAGGSSSAEVAGHNSGEVGTSPPALSNLLGEALVLYRKGEFNAAISKYQDYLKDHPQSPDAVAGMVRVYLKQKKVDQAVQVAEQGLAHSDSPRIRVARAEVWFRQGRITEAENEWVKVINSGFQEARAYLGLGRVRNAIAMYKTGKRLLDKAHELDPDDPDIYEHWISTLSRAERIKYLQNALAGENNWDADQRSSVASYLEYLNERAKRKNTSPCRLVSKVTGTETRLVRLLIDPQHLRGYGLDVFLNGHKSSLLLDTGASGILVKRSIAEHAGMSKITETKVWGIGNKGGRNAYRSIADSIKVGDLEFQNCPVEVMESSSVVGEDGLIGADVFEQFLVDLDFPNEKLRLSELPKRPSEAQQNLALNSEDDDSDDAEDTAEKPSDPKEASANAATANAKPASPPSGPQDRYIAPEMQSYTRILRFGHDLLIPTTIGNVPYKLFLMDTGAVMNAISPAAAREVTKVHNDDTTVRGISGKVDKVYSANKAVLSFGHLRQENQDMTAFDTTNLSDGVGTEISGFLGFVLLRFLDIKIDYRDALIDFQYDAKHWNR
jgi:tetratricopeptide (TPR) repeat protein